MGKFSNILKNHVTALRNSGDMENPDPIGMAGAPARGAFLVLCLRVKNGRIAEAKFQAYGRGPTIAAGSMLTEMIVTAEQLAEQLTDTNYSRRSAGSSQEK
jgi:NifU-like protein involved in Fe-S cluster formation